MTLKERTWEVSEAPFVPNKLHHGETILTIGNGYLGLRATFEEGYPGELVSTLVHGIFDHASGELVPELVNIANPLPVTVWVDGEAFHMTRGKVLGYRRTLEMDNALLQRGLIWQNSQGTIVQITFERFASLELEHILAQRIFVRALNRPCTIRITASLDSTQTNEGVNHWGELQTGQTDDTIFVTGKTGQSGYRVALLSSLIAEHGQTAKPVKPAGKDIPPAMVAEVSLQPDQAATFYKLTAIHTNRDADDPKVAAQTTLGVAKQRGWDSLLTAHTAAWAATWHDCDIEIVGDELAQRAIRFAMYHVLIAAPQHDEHASIGAKTLSGPGYKGHVFWDTELFMLPFLTVTKPDLARNLLMYRYHNLQGARHKAREAGYEGAMFPWESADTGEETTPRWTHPDAEGKRIRIWTGDTEQHISTDIAYAVMQYWGWTNDVDFFVKHGAEIVLDTAVFWGTRVEYQPDKDRFELTMQIGPDEYHENINNSVFTNSMVRWHLQTALEVRQWLLDQHPQEAEGLLKRLDITPKHVTHWQQIIDKMYIPHDPKLGILEQFDYFFNLERVDLSHWRPRVTPMDAILGHETIQHKMIIKQADVVMLTALQPDVVGDQETRLRNWNYYYPLVDHGSSLSPSTHAWVAARLKLMQEAYNEFLFASRIDLEDAKGNVRDGIHGAAAGGLWEAVIFGFAGLHLENGAFAVDPQLPEDWKSITFRLYFHGEQHTVHLTAK